MSLDIHIADDFSEIVDWLKPVTVDGQSVAACLRRAIDTREAAASGGKYLASDVAFHLDAAEHPQRPDIGSVIVDTAGSWTILTVARQTFANRWRCVCRQLWIDPSLTVTVQRATYARGITGAVEPTWATLASGVVAKIHIESVDVEATNANRTTRQKASVYFSSVQDLRPSDRIISSDGVTLKVLMWEGLDDIEQLFKATCEVSKWPNS